MKLKLIFLLIVLIVSATSETDAQIRSILREKAREAIRNKEAEEAERIEQERAEKEEQEENEPRKPSALERRMMKSMGFTEVEHETSYEFSSSMIMEVENFDAETEEVSRIDYTTFFNQEDESFAMRFTGVNEETGKKENSLMIFDMKNEVMLMLAESDGERSGMAFSLATDSISDGAPADEPVAEYEEEETGYEEESGAGEEITSDDYENYSMLYTKTGRTKNINGYTCEEYLRDDEESRTEYWFSPEAQLDYSDAYNYIGGFQALSMGGAAFNGMLMEMTHVDKETNDRAKMVVKEIKSDSPSTIDLTGFSIMGFGGGAN